MLRRNVFGRRSRSKEAYQIKWKIPSDDGWKRVPVAKVPTQNLLNILSGFAKKGYSKIRGIVDNEDAWMVRYITEIETELDKRTDIDEYL